MAKKTGKKTVKIKDLTAKDAKRVKGGSLAFSKIEISYKPRTS